MKWVLIWTYQTFQKDVVEKLMIETRNPSYSTMTILDALFCLGIPLDVSLLKETMYLLIKDGNYSAKKMLKILCANHISIDKNKLSTAIEIAFRNEPNQYSAKILDYALKQGVVLKQSEIEKAICNHIANNCFYAKAILEVLVAHSISLNQLILLEAMYKALEHPRTQYRSYF